VALAKPILETLHPNIRKMNSFTNAAQKKEEDIRKENIFYITVNAVWNGIFKTSNKCGTVAV